MGKPRSISGKRAQMAQAWQAWLNSEISGAERDRLSAPYLAISGLSSGTLQDADTSRANELAAKKAASAANRAGKSILHHNAMALKYERNARRAKTFKTQTKNLVFAEKEHGKADRKRAIKAEYLDIAASHRRTLYMHRDNVRDNEAIIASKLLAGEHSIWQSMDKGIQSGKTSHEKRDKAVERWRDSTERNIRLIAEARAKQRAELAALGIVETTKQPGVDWQGGQLRAGDMPGHVMPYAIAALSFVDKYTRSTMPNSGIVPNLNVSGKGADGIDYIDKVPSEIMEKIQGEISEGIEPSMVALLKWLSDFCEMHGIDLVALFADDADEFDT